MADRESRRHSRRVVRPGTEQGPVAGLSADERAPGSPADVNSTGDASSNDQRLREDVPPHWEPSRRF